MSVCHTKPSLIRHVPLADIIATAIQCHYLKTLCSRKIFSVQNRGSLSLHSLQKTNVLLYFLH